MADVRGSTNSLLYNRTQILAGPFVVRAVAYINDMIPWILSNDQSLIRIHADGNLPGVRGSVKNVIGGTRITGFPATDVWSTAGFECPIVTEYKYSKDAGLRRTQMESGLVRQRRRWADGRRTANVSCRIKQTQIPQIDAFLVSIQYGAFTMGLITGDNSTNTPELHTVRVKENPIFNTFQGLYCKCNLIIEIR